MTTQLALDATTNDLIKLPEGGYARVDGGRYTVQLVQTKLKTFLGEYLLGPDKGWVNFDDFKRSPDLFDIEMRAVRIILSCKGVKSISSINLTLAKRVLTVDFVASTIYGEIQLSVPWRIS